MKVIDTRWFAGRDCVGIVQVVQEHELADYRHTGNANFKYYIGVGWGEDERTDSTYIAEHGTPFDVAAGNTLFRVLDNPVPI
jgi:hypothetical protein